MTLVTAEESPRGYDEAGEIMKSCPWCQKTYSFLQFLSACGSDSLIRHPKNAHPREHRCRACGKAFWVSYDGKKYEQFTWQYAFSILGASFALSFGALSFFGVGHVSQAVLIGIVLFLLFLPPVLAFARYQSASLKAEK